MGLFQSVSWVNKKKRRSVRSARHALLSASPACTPLLVPSSSVQGPPQIPTETSEANNFNGWLCRARDVQTKRVFSISEAFSPSQRLKSSCDEDTTEIFMGTDHTQSQGDAGATVLSSGHMCEGAFTSEQTELKIPHCCPRPVGSKGRSYDSLPGCVADLWTGNLQYCWEYGNAPGPRLRHQLS